MSTSNLSAVLHGPFDLRLEERPILNPGHGEVQISMRCVGLCGTDVSYWKGTSRHIGGITSPLVMGHEPSGVVSQVGPGVDSLQIGDRVALMPGIHCGECNYCKKGLFNVCSNFECLASPPTHGSLSRFFVHPARYCLKLPESVSLETGALLQPLAISIHAAGRANMSVGNRVLVCGAGPMGAVNMLTAKANGAGSICVTDVLQHRLDLAKELGANHTILVTEGEDPKVTAKRIREALGFLADVTIECTESAQSKQTAIYATRSGGCVIMVGFGSPLIELPIVHASSHEIDLKGTIGLVDEYPAALSMVVSGKMDLTKMVTHRFSLEEAEEAFKTAQTRQGVKIVINCEKTS